MKPYILKNEIEDALSKQLRFMYPIDVVCPDSSVAREIKRLFPVGDEDKDRRHEFVKSAYVEAIPQYKPGRTLQKLVTDGVLHASTAEALSRYFKCPIDKARLHEHQEASLVSVRDGQNLLVCTGTGSGKTESFLIPVLDAIARERIEKGETYVPGVRAMILYPMNALVNDQVLRIRNLLKYAQGSNDAEEIDGIKDITYGIYTGDVATESKEQDLEELDEAALNAINEAPTVPVDHPFFSDDVVPRTEYTRRSRWNSVEDGGDGPADILITNYAMLERLMLNPKTSSLFSDTWKFIILDEAHTYDGSMGTEIAWLLKRLSYRVGGAKNLQYLATSATLIESDDGDEEGIDINTDIKHDIVDRFASKIFPTNNKSFSIQLGNPQYTQTEPGRENGHYSAIINKAAIDVHQYIKELPEQFQPGSVDTLFKQYLWLKEVEQRMERYSYLKEENIKENMALGDIACIASLLSELGEQRNLKFSGKSIADVLAMFPGKERIISRAVMEYCSDFEEELRYRVEDWFLGENNDDVILRAQEMDKVSMCIVSIFDSYDISDIEGFTPGTLLLQIANETMAVLKEYVAAYNQWCVTLGNIRKELQTAWCEFFDAEEGMGVEGCFTQYILEHGELHRLVEYMKGKSHVEYNELAQRTTGDDVSHFGDFCQVLALSKSDISINKPLVDLRFHQTVQGVHAVMGRFGKENNAVSVDLLPNMSGGLRDGERIYNVGCCQHCGHPYILAYSECREPDEVTNLTNYEDDKYEHLFALAWEPAKMRDDLSEADDAHICHWLEFKKGKLHRSYECPGAEDDFIRIHYVATAGNAVNRKHISKCPACGDVMNKGGDYTLIAPYKLSDDHTRCLILRVLTANADRDLVPAGKPAEGRKVLAFSDSRAMAARLPITFDEISRHKLFDNIVYKAVSKYEQAVSFSPCPQNGDISIVDDVIDELKKRHADLLLTREYLLREDVRDFPVKDVASQLILETVRNPSSRGLVGRKYLEVVSHAYENRLKNPQWERFVRACGGSSELAETIFQTIFRYLVRKGQLTCQYLQPDSGRGNFFFLDYTGAEDGDYSLGKKIGMEQGNEKDTIAFFKRNNPTSYFSDLIDKYDVQRIIQDKVRVLDKLLDYMTKSNCLIAINGGRYVVNAADIRLRKGMNNQDGLFFDDSYFFRIEEHSGQIAKGVALAHQRGFSSGGINILSCSTTFEMGVDLGNLNTVFLCNLPPSVANYRQRAGRAGRRAGSSAYVLTYVGSESAHDSYFSNEPASFLFQKVAPPIIYTDILSYSAKHMRAEALSCFLEWCGAGSTWKRCSSFFANPVNTRELGLIRRLEEWYAESSELVMQRCKEIAGYELEYNPAADLCFQLVGTHYDEVNNHSLIELAGPCLDIGRDGQWNYWKSPALYRYIKKCEKLLGDREDAQNRACRRMGREDIAAYLASIRVLPRYGFPCDTVQMNVPDPDVKLQRDRMIALREYLPGSAVAANKKYYESRWPQEIGDEPQSAVNAQPIRVYKCAECSEFFAHYDEGHDVRCPKCLTVHDGNHLKLIVPDYFKGRRVIKKGFKKSYIRECYGGGQQRVYQIPETNLAVASSDTREILYVNTEWHNNNADGMMHVLRTDIVVWKLINIPDDIRNKLKYDAWMSALQAILKSASKVLNVHSKDISGMISQVAAGDYMMVIYDSSTSGAGSVLKLMPGNRQEGIEVEIIRNALKLCVNGDCSCGQFAPEEGNKTVVRDVELYNGADINTSRLAKACYKCLLSYGNRRHHSMLDTYDAAVILNAMLGNQPIGPKTDDGNSRQGRANNPPGVGKQAPDSQTASKDRVVTADFELAVINRGLCEAVREGTPRNEIQGQNSQQQQNSHSDKEKEICLTERSLSQYQTFEPIEGNYSLMKKMISCKGETFLVRKDGKVFADRLKRVLSGHRALFENAGTVVYADIMKM